MEEEPSEFILKLQNFKNEGLRWRGNRDMATVWDAECDELLDKIDDWISLAADMSEEVAEREFERSPLAGCSSFLEYLTRKGTAQQNVNVMRLTNRTAPKTKSVRTTSKIDKCGTCGGPRQIQGNKAVCMKCGESEDITGKALKQKANGMKHTKNKIELLLGRRSPPNKIERLYELLKIWLTDLSYCYAWLAYQESFVMMKNKKTKEQWITNFRKIYMEKPCVAFEDMKRPEVKEAAWTYPEYKMLMMEFHAMLKECDRLSSLPEYVCTNMTVLDDDTVLEIMQAFYDENERVPNLAETFIYKDKTYDVGNFINLLKLTNDTESELHKKINEIFETEICIPGLMCNFLIQPVKTVERFALTEGYSYVVHRVFAIPYLKMPDTDIEKILELIQAFDAYIQKTEQHGTKKSNSKLYVCKLRCIFQMPYFYKYAELVNYLPVKSIDTTAKIMSKWDFFEATDGKALVEQYYVSDDTEEEEEKEEPQEGRKLFDGFFK